MLSLHRSLDFFNDFYSFGMVVICKKWFYAVLIFFIIFAFPVFSFLSSAKLVMFYVLGLLLLTCGLKKYINLFVGCFSKFSIIYYLVFFFTISITVLWSAFDWSLSGRVFSSFLLYFVAFCLFQFAKPYVNIEKAIVYCFVVQSVFIILSIFSESFYDLVGPFRKVADGFEMKYGRLRGNAVSGYQFFGISSMYTFVIAYLILHLKNFRYGLIMLFLLSIAGVCGGRYTVVGIIIGVCVLLWRNIVEGRLGKVVWICVGTTLTVVLSVTLLYQYVEKISDPLMYKVVSDYLIDPIDSILVDESFESSSTNVLMDMYQRDDIKQYFLLGAGKYETENGGYFGGVDIGYYRMLGYYGVLGFILITYAIYYLIYRTRSDLDIYTKHAFFIIFLVLNIKGDVQVFNNNIVPIVVAFLFFCSVKQKNSVVNMEN